MLLKNIFKVMFLFTGFFYCFSSFANVYESWENIEAATKNFITQNVPVGSDESLEVRLIQTNSPMKVPVCSKEINAAFPQEANKAQITAIELSCDGDKPWHTFVPVSVQIYTKVVVAKRAIAANDTITEEDVDYSKYDKTRLYSGYFNDQKDVIGQQAFQLITAGSVLTKKNVQLPQLVHRNQAIDLTATRNTVVVTMKGIAKSDGRLNDVIKAYNPSSKQILDAVVVGPNRAEVLS